MKTLEKLRKQIDRADHKILKALKKRFEIVEKIGHQKAKHGIAPYQRSRSLEVLKCLAKEGKKMGLDAKVVTSLYKQILAESVKTQTRVIKMSGKKKI